MTDIHIYPFRVVYSDTDQMGFMHHSCYLKYYETARWEYFRQCGYPYSVIEKEGIILPIIHSSIQYIKPAYYDQCIDIKTKLLSWKGARLCFECTMENEDGVTINQAAITLACVSKELGIACPPFGKLACLLDNHK